MDIRLLFAFFTCAVAHMIVNATPPPWLSSTPFSTTDLPCGDLDTKSSCVPFMTVSKATVYPGPASMNSTSTISSPPSSVGIIPPSKSSFPPSVPFSIDPDATSLSLSSPSVFSHSPAPPSPTSSFLLPSPLSSSSSSSLPTPSITVTLITSVAALVLSSAQCCDGVLAALTRRF
ncbi:hypothetical protein DENSPDRAFT_406880 [Dentipellis sp. KUC8613]|nr:hypothetical protein DENSPDRAFT_406880 [Dentipellis sp. KUC8613]